MLEITPQNINEKTQQYTTHLQNLMKSQKTINAYKETIITFFTQYNPPTLTPETLYGFKAWKENKTKKQISAKTMNRHISALRSFLEFNNQLELAKKIKHLKTQRTFKTLPYEHIKKAIEYPPILSFYRQRTKFQNPNTRFLADRLFLLHLLLIDTGIRINEAYNLTKYDIRNQTKDTPAHIIIKKGKGGKTGTAPISQQFINQYNEYTKKYPQQTQIPALFTTTKGTKLGITSLMNETKSFGHYIGIPELSVHKFRHAFAEKYYQKTGKDLRAVQTALRHESSSTTSVYLDGWTHFQYKGGVLDEIKKEKKEN